jgi:hypothetical protein
MVSAEHTKPQIVPKISTTFEVFGAHLGVNYSASRFPIANAVAESTYAEQRYLTPSDEF